MPRTESSKKSTTVRMPLAMRATITGVGLLGRTSPALASRVGYYLWTKPRRFPVPAREEELLRSATHFTVPYHLGGLKAWRWGDEGPVALLVHGWEGRGSQLGAFVEPLLRQGYQVVTFDGPGHGRSPGSRAAMPTLADGVGAVLRHLGDVEALVTHSFGGAFSMLALSAGVHVPRVAMIAAPDVRFALDRFSDMVAFRGPTRRRLDELVVGRFGTSTHDMTPERIVGHHEGKALLVHDVDDRFVPHTDMLALAEAHRDVRTLSTEGLGHHRILRDQAVIDAVTSFLGPAAG